MIARLRKKCAPILVLMALMLGLAVGGVSIMGVDFAANASSRMITERAETSAAITINSGSVGTTISADGKTVSFPYNGTTYNYGGTTDGSNNADSLVGNQGTAAANQTLANIGTDGSTQSVTLQPGTYKVVLYGAQGACNRRISEDGGGGGPTEGGYGGYSEAILHIRKPTTIYVTVGGKGNARASWKTGYVSFNTPGAHSDRAASAATDAKLLRGGGYNGGGHWLPNYVSRNDYSGGGGGGATHIALVPGELRTLEEKKDQVLLVAGGGGGASWTTSASYYGSGGGEMALANVPVGSYTAYCAGGAGTQTGSSLTAGIKVGSRGTATAGGFGYGGNGYGCTDGGGGGGGGWYGGGGGVINGGGGGSSYYSRNVEWITNALLLNGGNNVNAKYTGTDTRFGHKGHGSATITLLDNAPVQSTVPTLELSRTTAKEFALAGTQNNGTNLLGKDLENQTIMETSIGKYQGIFMTNDTAVVDSSTGQLQKADAAANSWLSYSFSDDRTKITNVKATRYWSGTKRFYVRVTDTYSYGSTEPNGVWFAFDATCKHGELKKDASGPSSAAWVDKFSLGVSNTNVPNEASTSNVFNPRGVDLRTIWLKTPVSAQGEIALSVDELFPSTLDTDDVAFFDTAVVYDTNRYDATSTVATAGEAITKSDPGETPSSKYYTEVTFADPVEVEKFTVNQFVHSPNVGSKTIKLKAKTERPAGNFYYTIRVTVRLWSMVCGAEVENLTFDIVYKVDNTRPDILGDEKLITLSSDPGATNHKVTLALSDLILDPDLNTLSVADVVVPEHEYIAVNQYGYLKKTAAGANSNYNRGIVVSGAAVKNEDITPNTTLLDAAWFTQYGDVIKTAQNENKTTGFYSYKFGGRNGNKLLYHDASDGYNTAIDKESNKAALEEAYVHFKIVDTDKIEFTGNTATRSFYNDSSTRLGHFYVLIRIIDAGDPNDDGIWFPVALQVNSSSPITANSIVEGNVGESFVLSPMGVQTSSSVFAVGTYQFTDTLTNDLTNDADHENGVNSTNILTVEGKQKKPVKAIATDYDNYLYQQTATRTIAGVNVDGKATATPAEIRVSQSAGLPASFAQRAPVFLDGTSNDWMMKGGTANASVSYQYDGFKQFFTIERVPLYASTAVLGALPDATIQDLVGNGVIAIVDEGNQQYVKYDGLKVTLKKWTKNLYLSVNVNVIDTNGGTASIIRIPIKVNNSALTNENERVTGELSDGQKAFNSRGTVLNTTPAQPIAARETSNSSSGRFVFKFRLLKGESINISPYDLFYENDTYDVNNGEDGTFNTVPGGDGYVDLMKKIYEGITVFAAADADAEPTKQDIQFEDLKVGNQNPSVSGEFFGTATYKNNSELDGLAGLNGSTETNASLGGGYFTVTATSKSGTGCLSFVYEVAGSSGDTVRATVEVYVLNSLPVIRRGDVVTGAGETDVPDVFNLTASTDLEFVNSSDKEDKVASGVFPIDEESYNVREFKLNDLFKDPDGDLVKFVSVAAGIEVGTKDVDGNFIKFDDTKNVFIKAQIGAGSNHRLGDSNCIILTGLSSTQGLPGGLWIRVDITDNAMGNSMSVQYLFQVEVLNSNPIYREFTGENAMEELPLEASDTSTVVNTWTVDAETTAALRKNLKGKDGSSISDVARPLYIAANPASMAYYYDEIRALTDDTLYNTDLTHNFTYNATQVRYIATDPDQAQGLCLTTKNYENGAYFAAGKGLVPAVTFDGGYTTGGKFNNGAFKDNGAVLVSDFYNKGAVNTEAYYIDNHVVTLHFYDNAGNVISTDGLTKEADIIEKVKAMHTATNWVVAFNFTSSFNTKMVVTLNLRDSANAFDATSGVNALDGVDGATQGGWAVSPDGSFTSYRGVREIKDNGDGTKSFVPNEIVQPGLDKKDFKFAVKVRGQGLINNFTKWVTDAKVENPTNNKEIDLNGVWTANDTTGTRYYFEELNKNLDNDTVFRYQGVTVGEGATVLPISYFAWAAATKSAPASDSYQENVAWFNFTKTPQTKLQVTEENKNAILGCISLTDGYKTWTGAELANNPYLTINFVNDSSLNDTIAASDYYKDQQRFYVGATEGTGGKKQLVSMNSAPSSGKIYFEDTWAITLTKNMIRSVGNLTMTVDMVPWTYNINQYEIHSDNGEDTSQKISVPVAVENNAVVLNTNEADIVTNATAGGARVALTNDSRLDIFPDGTTRFEAASQSKDKFTTGEGGTLTDRYNGTRYREDLYFMAASVNGTFTADELSHIQSDLYKATNVKGRLCTYFGVTTLSDAVGADGQLATGIKEKINPNYQNYFTVTPSVDSQMITITPIRNTTVAGAASVTGTTNEDKLANVKNLIKDTGLDAKLLSSGEIQIFYPLRLLVYDTLYVGTFNNRTPFSQSSIDVVTINIVIENSAPQIQKANFGNSFKVSSTVTLPLTGITGKKEVNVGGTYERQMRTIKLTKGETVDFKFTDVFTDDDMVETGTGAAARYMTKEEITALDTSDPDKGPQNQLIKDTADYLMVHGENSKRVLVRFLKSDGTLENIEHPDTDSAGAVSVNVDDNSFSITVNKRDASKSVDNVAAYVMIAFLDSHGAYALAFYDVRIDNQAPVLTTQASAVSSIEMKTDQYFTLYTTPYSIKNSENKEEGFIAGANIETTTVGKLVNGAYDGMYWSDRKNQGTWTYNEKLENISIGKVSSTAGSDGATGSSNHDNDNLGYMAIATDDTPWSLRITKIDASVSSNYVQITEQNAVPWEGTDKDTSDSERQYMATAVRFTAKGACRDAQFSVTLYDGNGQRYVTYNFRITVTSTTPQPISPNTSRAGVILGDSLGETYMPVSPSSNLNANYLSYTEGFAFTESGEVGGTAKGGEGGYTLRMYVGQEIELKTSDLAYDVDHGDSEKMYLLGRSGNNPFTIATRGGTEQAVYSTNYITLTPKTSGTDTRFTSFTVKATNFHNDTGNDPKMKCDVVTFYICDTSYADQEHSVKVTLNVYVFPSEIKRAGADQNAAADISVLGISDYLKDPKPTEVALISTESAEVQGLLIDNDADASMTQYSVTVYTMFEPDADANFTVNESGYYNVYEKAEFERLFADAESSSETHTTSASILDHNLIATYSASGTTPATSKGSAILMQYIDSITFTNSGTVMRIMPKKATNDISAMQAAAKGVKLFIRVQKDVERGSGNSDFGPKFVGVSSVADSCDLVANTVVRNSLPKAIGDTSRNFNAKNDGQPFLTFQGVKGDEATYKMYDPSTLRDIALFVDPDGDPVLYNRNEIIGMYTLPKGATDLSELEEEDLTRPVERTDKGTVTIKDLGTASYSITTGSEKIPYNGKEYTVSTLKFTILNKIVLPDENKKDRPVYVKVRVYGYDFKKDEAVSTVVTLIVCNDAPAWKSAEEIDTKYNSTESQNSYENNYGEVTMKLTVCKDNVDGLLGTNGRVIIPFTDLVNDKDYSATSTKEYFEFPSVAELDAMGNPPVGTPTLADLDKQPSYTIGLLNGTATLITPENSADRAKQRFLIGVNAENNIKRSLVITVNSYERGAQEEVLIVLRDSTGAVTGNLRLILVVGNSTPIDLTRVEGSGVSGSIVLEGGKEGLPEYDGGMKPVAYNICDYVTDKNSEGTVRIGLVDPSNPLSLEKTPEPDTKFLRIVEIVPGTPVFDPASDYTDHLITDPGMGDPTQTEPGSLVSFTNQNQKFTIAPLTKLYGTQSFVLRISDIGNTDDTAGSATIELRLDVRVTQKPSDMTANDVSVYWKRTKAITAAVLFDDPATTDIDESKGFVVTEIKLKDMSQSSMVEIVNPSSEKSIRAAQSSLTSSVSALNADPVATVGAPTVRGVQRSGDSKVGMEAKVVVGSVVDGEIVTSGASEPAMIGFDIEVADNGKPTFMPGYGGGSVHYVYKADFTDKDGSIFRLPIDKLLYDVEGDDLQLESAKSKKSTLITVTADRQNNELVFHFKSKGTSTITVHASDAVGEYSYTFEIGNNDLPAPNFFIAIISRIQANPLIWIVIALAIILLLIILIVIIATIRKKKRMREEIEALLVSEMELEEQMLKLAASPSPTYYQSYGYLPPTQNVQQPGFMLGQGQSTAQPNTQAIGLNPGNANAVPNTNPGVQPNNNPNTLDGFNDDDL